MRTKKFYVIQLSYLFDISLREASKVYDCIRDNFSIVNIPKLYAKINEYEGKEYPVKLYTNKRSKQAKKEMIYEKGSWYTTVKKKLVVDKEFTWIGHL